MAANLSTATIWDIIEALLNINAKKGGEGRRRMRESERICVMDRDRDRQTDRQRRRRTRISCATIILATCIIDTSDS
jgi:hypothetical protein